MKFQKINYPDLNTKQKELYNFHKVAAVLADYGFNCIKLTDDWNGADFIAVHKDGKTLKVQLKGRFTIAKKYQKKGIYMAFPVNSRWCLVPHDYLVYLAKEHMKWNWEDRGIRHPPTLPKKLLPFLEKYMIS